VRAADRLARANYSNNLDALRLRQHRLSIELPDVPPNLEWIFARDGALTAIDDGQRWWSGCSVPRKAAQFMFKNMDVTGGVACFLGPQHAAQLRVVLDTLDRRQALIAIVPEPTSLAVILHCEDFSSDIAAGRAWFVCGDDWDKHLKRLLNDNPGLPTPGQFLRPITADSEPFNRMIAPAQRVFADINACRSDQIRSLASQWSRKQSGVRRVCMIANSSFRLWDDAGETLARLDLKTHGIGVTRFDPDQAAISSPLALANAAAGCDAIVAANLGRSDAPGVICKDMPWISWITTPRLPSAADAGPADRLLLADPSWHELAAKAGWATDRIEVARWPTDPITDSHPAGTCLAMIADTGPIEIPPHIAEYSSQQLLWEFIEAEMAYDPLSLDETDTYLAARRSKFQIAEAGFDASTFIERLIVPALQQSLARLLLQEGFPLRLFGIGWDAIPELAEAHGGPVWSREHLREICGQAAALVHAWPWRYAHPIESAGLPLLRSAGQTRISFLSDARAALSGNLAASATSLDEVISANLICRLLQCNA
jgi:hypothetical protein